MHEHRLDGPDGENPLGFLAALGLLRVLDDHAVVNQGVRPSLAWADAGAWRPVIRSALDMPGIIQAVLDDASAQAADPVLSLAYNDDGVRVPPDTSKASRDLKPSPAVGRAVLTEAASQSRRSADLAAGLFTDLVVDNKGNTKPTALHFTAGQQQFLAMLEELRLGLSQERMQEALNGPWMATDKLPSLSWDSSATRYYALRASNPSDDKRGSVAAANWLASIGLSFLPVLAVRGAVATTCVRGGWKDSTMTWPLWSAPAGVRVLRGLLATDWSQTDRTQRRALGGVRVVQSDITRSDQGGYGSFSPARTLFVA
jgi:hypothetical protein